MYLGIDLGTSGLKALILDDRGHIQAMATRPLTVQRAQASHSEQDPADWIQALQAVFAELREHLPNVRGIGLAGHMHGLVLLDQTQKVLRPCLLWNDTRAHGQAAHLDAHPLFSQLSGNLVFPGFSAPKMAWVRDEEPEIWAQTRHMLFPKDMLGLWLTGHVLSEPSDAAGASLFDGEKNSWSEALCEAADLPSAVLPDLVASDAPRGTVRPDLCAAFGIAPGTLVAGGAGDNAAAALGAGCVSGGQSLLSLGTSGVLLTVNETWQPQAKTAVHTFAHGVRGRYIQMGVTLCAMDSLVWLAEVMGTSPQELTQTLEAAPSAPSDLLFLPYLAGERTPHNFSEAAGAFLGLSRRHDRTDMVRAVLDGVAFSLGDCCRSLAAAGADVGPPVLVGGGGHVPYLVQALAHVLDRPIKTHGQANHVAAIGAACLGRAAADGVPVQDLIPLMVSKSKVAPLVPSSAGSTAYARGHQRYANAYEQLKRISNGLIQPAQETSASIKDF